MKNCRDTALVVLMTCRKDGAWSDGALKTAVSDLSTQDAALATRLVYGVLQNRLRLDFILSAYCSQKPEKLEPLLLDILRLGAYQILYLDRIPDSAAVNESVELAKKHGKRQASGLVNAVLRKVSQNKNALPEIPKTDLVTYLSLTYSHPKWLVKRLLTLLGEGGAEGFLRENNALAPLTVQVNRLKIDSIGLTQALEDEGVTVSPHPWLADCLLLSGTGNLSALTAFQRGLFWVQDPAAKLVSLAAGCQPGDHVIDVCAAPGGKSFAAAVAMADQGRILSCDIHTHKLGLLQLGAERLGLSCIQPMLADGREHRELLEDWGDIVVVDAPCSGLGIIRKKPDIRYKAPGELTGLSTLQGEILANAATYVKPGGVLVYSTCTILPEENQGVTDSFLDSHPDFSRETFSLPTPIGGVEGQLTLWPQTHGTDGFYICRMRRNTL
ncbi:MAG: 16S rRNA (cytosine(967)-C(5))-methyltransferase RsmB [Oscillospiraceae bacterium]